MQRRAVLRLWNERYAHERVNSAVYDATVAKWRARHDDYQRVGAIVSGEKITAEVLADLEAIARATDDEVLTLAEAAEASGYSSDHLRRLIRDGKLPNAGRSYAPRIRRGDLPHKAGTVLPLVQPMQHDMSASRAEIVRAVVNGD